MFINTQNAALAFSQHQTIPGLVFRKTEQSAVLPAAATHHAAAVDPLKKMAT